MIASLKEIRDLLKKSSAGKILLGNFLYDFEKKNLPLPLTKKFIKNLKQRVLREGVNLNGGNIKEVISAVLDNSTFQLKGNRKPQETIQLSRVMSISDFYRYNIDDSFGLEINDTTGDVLWENLDDPDININLFFVGWLKTKHNFFWATTKDDLESVLSNFSNEEKALGVKNVLGLLTMSFLYEESPHLLKVDIPLFQLEDKSIKAPTSFDAGVNIAFAPSDDPEGFGWTRHLDTNEKGIKEVVVEMIPFTKEFTLEKIGVINNNTPVILECFDIDERAKFCLNRCENTI